MSELAAAITAGDHTRGPGARTGGSPWKEWHHFVVFAGGLELVVNLSVGRDTRAGGRGLQGRVVTLWRTGGAWRGDVAQHPVAHVPAGRIALQVGTAQLGWDGRAYTLHLPDGPLRVALRLHPQTLPALSTQVPFGGAARVDWLVVPRLGVEGSVRVDGQDHAINGALAYHDHNWGRFHWGDDFAWEWGFVLPDDPSDPHALVFTRLLDRQRRQVRSQGLFLWRGAHQRRMFVGQQLRFSPSGAPPPGEPCDLPPVMGMLLPGRAAGVPGALRIEATDLADRLTVDLQIGATSRLAVPDEGPHSGLTLLSETSARAQVAGVLHGQPISLRGRAVVEFVRAEPGPPLPAAPAGPRPDPHPLPEHRAPGLFAAFLRATTAQLHHEDPARMAAVARALGPAPIRVQVQGPAFRVRAEAQAPVIVPDGAEAALTLTSSHAAVLRILDGQDDLTAAVRSGRLELRGAPGPIAALLDALLLYVHSAVRSAAMPALLARYRRAASREIP